MKKYLKLSILFHFFLLVSLPQQGFTWSAPSQVSDLGMNFQPQAAINSAGNAEIVWISGTYPTYIVNSSTFASGSWLPPVEITSGLVSSAQIGKDSSGNAVAAWVQKIGSDFAIRASTKPAAGIWSVPVTLSTSSFNHTLSLKVNTGNQVIAGWINGVASVVEVTHLTFGGAWTGPIAISNLPAGLPLDLVLDIDSNGNGYAIWKLFFGNDIYAANSNGLTWNVPVLLNGSGDNDNPCVATGGANQALASWANLDLNEIRTAKFSGSTWSPIVDVISSNGIEAPVVGSVGLNGFVAWLNVNTGMIEGANYNSGSWNSPLTISDSVDNETPTISKLTNNDAVIAWSNFTDGTVNAVIFPNGSAPGAVQAISSSGYNVSVTSASRGLRTIVAWQTVDEEDSFIFATIN